MPSAPLDAADRAVLDHLLAEAMDFLDQDRLGAAAADLAEAEAMAPNEPAVLAGLGQLAWAHGQLDRARQLLSRAVAADPALVDAHYALGRLFAEAGNHEAQVRHDLQVLRLDTAAHRRAGLGSRAQVNLIERVAEQTLTQLPAPFAERLRSIPVMLEARPGPELVREGFDPRAFGLFEGPEDFGRQAHVITDRPTRIVVFFANLLDAFADDEQLAQQVEITLLHEIGHFFGLDEDGVAALGLE